MTEKEVIIDGVDIFKEIDEWADIVSQNWSSDEYSKAEIIKNYILELQAENEELKQWQVDAENILKEQLDNFDKTENRYKQALEKIEEILQQDYVELSDISKVINEVKDER